jgi:tripartite-type tricarboxylate transporter receptor subunit TctC
MQGSGSVQASTYATSIAPQDGTVLLNPLNSLPLVKVLGQINTPLDPAQFNWIGNLTADTGDIIISTTSPVKTVEDTKRIEVKMGATSPLALGGIYPKVMNRLLGTKFKIVTGYPGTAAVELALERGEVEGQAGGTWFKGQGVDYDWYQAGKIRVLVQIGYKAADLPDVPLLTDLAQNGDDKKLLELFSSPFIIGKPTAVGPNVPPERIAALRQAYRTTLSDPAFLADAAKLGATIVPTSGDELTSLIKRVMGLPDDLVQRARGAIQ